MASQLLATSATGTASGERRRQRLRTACEPCRERKRKCDGAQPCDLCRGYGYECLYRSGTRGRRMREAANRPAPVRPQPARSPTEGSSAMPSAEPSPQQRPDDGCSYVRSLESNSGTAFARLLTMTLDPSNSNAHPQRMLAWNLFLGGRQVTLPSEPQTITAVLSQTDMQELAAVYFQKLHPCYGFVDRIKFYQIVANRWSPGSGSSVQDAVLCGVAALACLFSGTSDLTTELSLVALTKRLLDSTASEPPSLYSATAWVLRTVYLRLTAKPEEAWLASCTSLHVIDAAGLHSGFTRGGAFGQPKHTDSPDIRRRVFGVAQHLNVWMSYDLARSRVLLQNIDPVAPSSQLGEYTTELLGLLPYSENLDPANSMNGDRLTAALCQVLDRVHSQPPSVLAQCNLMLCIYRRLHASKRNISDDTMAKLLDLLQRSIEAVRSAITAGLPWHHVANIPFQTICTLLAIDTPQSFTLLAEALSCLVAVSDTYQTEATKEAVAAAYALLQMHRKRREAEMTKHSEMLRLYPAAPSTHDEVLRAIPSDFVLPDTWLFDEFATGLDFEPSYAVQAM